MADKEVSKNMQQHGMDHENSLNPVASLEFGHVKDIKLKASEYDPAVVVLGQDQVEYTAEEGRDVLRRIDWHILPMLMWVYCIQFADKTSLNYASLMGIRTDVHLDPNSQQYSWASSIFYAGYIAWELVSRTSQTCCKKLTGPPDFPRHTFSAACRWASMPPRK
jgi:hypothetical protein